MSSKPRDRKSGAIEARRITIARAVDVSFPHFQGFVTEVSANISTTGMFIQSDDPQRPGTEFTFRFHIEEWQLIQGTAEVVWARRQGEGADRPAGMGVRFRDLDAQSRRLIRWLVERHLHEGGKPFELEAAGDGAPTTAGRKATGTQAGSTSPRGRRALWLGLTLLLAAVAALLLLCPGRAGAEPRVASARRAAKAASAHRATQAALIRRPSRQNRPLPAEAASPGAARDRRTAESSRATDAIRFGTAQLTATSSP